MFRKIPNPYHPYDVKAGRSYYNKSVIHEIRREFESTPPRKIIFIHGGEGSGKSSTFDRIRNDPEIMDNRYIPIYIHSRKIVSENSSDLMSNLYEYLKTTIDSSGIQLFEDFQALPKNKNTLKECCNLFFALEQGIKRKHLLILLIFDDFDKFFELEEYRKNVAQILQFINVLSKEDRIRIILSGRSDFHGMTSSLKENVLTIRMKNLDTGEFNKTITEPVKDWVTYDPRALDEIRKVTGGNLYCQQLLCYYIIFYLNTEEKYKCEVEDIAPASELAINDEREDFNYFWEQLNKEDKLVCSAIMDESIVKTRGVYYFFVQDSLLSKVFEQETLTKILSRLYKKDFISKVDGRRFEDFPFKIPLYGNWIRKEHPFIKTVITYFDDIAGEKDFPSLGSIVEGMPREMFPNNRKDTVEFIQRWFRIKTILKEHGQVNREAFEVPLQLICKILDLTIKGKGDGASNFDYFLIDFGRLNIGSIDEAFFLIQDRLEPQKDDIRHLRDTIMAHASSTKPCLFFCLKRNEKIDELVQNTFLNIILIENEDLKKILFSSRPLQTLKDILLQRISSSQVSPYQTDGPAVTTFYGRQKELKKILGLTNRSFAIAGARKIGKSSLLARINKELEEMGAYSIFMDLESPANPDHRSFLQRMELELNRLFPDSDIRFSDDINAFTHTIKQLKPGREQFIFLLDEIDELLLYDQKHEYRLIRSFRSLFNERYCRFILSGFETLQNLKRSLDSPLYNFCEEIPLGPLEKQNALDLITDPMGNIGIIYENSTDRELILKYTSNHPNLIQFFCKHLIDKLDEHHHPARKRIISRSDIKDLYDYKYENYVIDDFYMFYTDLDDLEKLLVLLLIGLHPREKTISIRVINQELRSNGIDLEESRIHKTIQKLVLRFILIDRGKGKYSFALPHFPKILKERVEPELKINILNRIKEGNHGKSV
ncbi:MAG: ATP-binding protein [Candidatus Omnitrophota bacterium]